MVGPSLPDPRIAVAVESTPAQPVSSNILSSSPPVQSTVSTIEASIEDRLYDTEVRALRLRRALAQFQTEFKYKLTESVRGLKTELELCSHQVEDLEEQFTHFQAGVSREIDDKLDDMITGAKSEFQKCIREDMNIAESNIKDAISNNRVRVSFMDD